MVIFEEEGIARKKLLELLRGSIKGIYTEILKINFMSNGSAIIHWAKTLISPMNYIISLKDKLKQNDFINESKYIYSADSIENIVDNINKYSNFKLNEINKKEIDIKFKNFYENFIDYIYKTKNSNSDEYLKKIGLLKESYFKY